MRSLDWGATPLGPVSAWPQSLQTAVGMCLASRLPLAIYWGETYVTLYNDAYGEILAAKHPWALGCGAKEVWSERWDVVGPMLDGVLGTGEATGSDDLPLLQRRHGFPEECYVSFSFSPVRAEGGRIGGVFAVASETTARVVGERRLRVLADLAARGGEARTEEEACAIAADTLARHPEDVPFALLYLTDTDRKRARLAGAAGVESGRPESPLAFDVDGVASTKEPWPLAEALRSETLRVVGDLQEKLSRVPPGPWPAPPREAALLPIRSSSALQPAGLLVLGISSRLRLDAGYRAFCEGVSREVAAAIVSARERRGRLVARLDLARLTRQAVQREYELRTSVEEAAGLARLHELSTRRFASTEVHPTLEEILDATMELLNADFGNVQLLDRSTGALRIVAQRGFRQDFLDYFDRVHEGTASCGLALQRRERVIVEDVWTDPAFEAHREIVASAGYRAVQSTPLFSRSGEPLGMISTHFLAPHRPSERELRLTDLYARHAAEAIERSHSDRALARSEAYLAEGQKLSETGTWAWNPTTGEVYWSRQHFLIFGLDPEQPAPSYDAVFQMMHEEDAPLAKMAFERAVREKTAYDMTMRIVRPDGKVRHVRSLAHPILDASEGVVEYVGTVIDTTERTLAEEALKSALEAIETLKDRLTREKSYLEEEIRTERGFEDIVGISAALRKVLRQAETVAPTDAGVLIQGETGTGKELIARAIHQLSGRRDRTFVRINCAAIPTGLLEGELFGHEKGALTQRIGRFELADRGTIFLEEIGEVPLDLQAKLLRVLQERDIERLGGARTIHVDVRLIAATNRDLRQMMEEGTFRSDLFYRLSVFPIQVPPLRERRDDIPQLARHFALKYARRMMKKPVPTISPETMDALVEYAWPGNVRELENLIERSMIVSQGSTLEVPLPELTSALRAGVGSARLRDLERDYIVRVLEECDWVVAGPDGAAARLGMKRTSLQYRMQKLGIVRPRQAAISPGSARRASRRPATPPRSAS
jgi:PAS domain S-box-containing protein